MRQQEFEAMIGHAVTPESYDVIEFCYMNTDKLFPTKEAVVSYYKKHDLNFFEALKWDIERIECHKDLFMKQCEGMESKMDQLEAENTRLRRELQKISHLTISALFDEPRKGETK